LAHKDNESTCAEVIEQREREEEAYEFTRIVCDGKRTKRRASDHFRSWEDRFDATQRTIHLHEEIKKISYECGERRKEKMKRTSRTGTRRIPRFPFLNSPSSVTSSEAEKR